MGGSSQARRAGGWAAAAAAALAAGALLALATRPHTTPLGIGQASVLRGSPPGAGRGMGGLPDAGPFAGFPAVGALFTVDSRGRPATHFCTASVVASPAGDLILTAAHCVNTRRPARLAFVPGYRPGVAPFGVWRVGRVFIDQAWRTSHNPDHDFAFLQVGRPGSAVPVQRLTGAERLGFGLAPRQPVTTVMYPDSGGPPVRCRNLTEPFGRHQLEFGCRGFGGGASGGPMLAHLSRATGLGTITGVIGGYQQGGHTDSVSYAARLGRAARALYRSAAAAG